MNYIPDHSIDTIICDLPYGTTACKWDIIIPFDKLWMHYERLIKPKGAIVLFGNEPFSSHLRISKLNWFRYDMVWNKRKPSNFQLMNFQPGRIHEYVHIFSDSPAVYCNGKNMNYYPIKESITPYIRPRSNYGSKNSTLRPGHTIKELGPTLRTEKNKHFSILDFTNANIKAKIHPTEKPVALLECLVETYSKQGDLILDNCAGSGSTLIAAKNLGRQFIGIEKEQEYYNAALNRLNVTPPINKSQLDQWITHN